MTHSVSASAANVLKIICQTPALAHRINRLWTLGHFPYSDGKALHAAPLRATHITADINFRLSIAVLPGSDFLPGKLSLIFSHWSSLKSYIAPPFLEQYITYLYICRHVLGSIHFFYLSQMMKEAKAKSPK